MLDNEDIRAVLVAWLKANSTIVALDDNFPVEIREKDWQGEDFTYPNIRVTCSSIPSQCSYSNINATISYYSEQKSSKNSLNGQGIIAKQLHQKSIESNYYRISSIRVTSLPDAVREENGVWKADVLISALVTYDTQEYWQKVKALNPIAYWPLWDSVSSLTAIDLIGLGNGVLGLATAKPIMGVSGIGDGKTACSFDGGDYINIYSAALNSAFNPLAGTLAAWAKVSGSSVWTDGVLRTVVGMRVDTNNYVQVFKRSANNGLAIEYKAGGTSDLITSSAISDTGWFHIALTWDKSADAVKLFVNGVQDGSTASNLGTWAGGSLSPTNCCIGATTTAPANGWNGGISSSVLFTTALTPSQILDLYTIN